MSDALDDRSPLERELGQVVTSPAPSAVPEIRPDRILLLAQRRIGRGANPATQEGQSRSSLSPKLLRLGAAAGIVVALAAAGLILSALSSAPAHGPTDVAHVGESSTPSVSAHEMSQAKVYGSLTELGQDADLVVVGTVRSAGMEGADELGRPQVSLTFDIERTLKGTTKSSSITVLQRNVKNGDAWVSEEGSRLEVGDHVLLFLAPVPRSDGPAWSVVGGTDGQFVVTGSLVTSPQSGSPVPLPSGLTVDDVAKVLEQ